SGDYAEVYLGDMGTRYAYLSRVGSELTDSKEPVAIVFADKPATADGLRVPNSTTLLVQDGNIDGSTVTLWNGDEQVHGAEYDDLARQVIATISEKIHQAVSKENARRQRDRDE